MKRYAVRRAGAEARGRVRRGPLPSITQGGAGVRHSHGSGGRPVKAKGIECPPNVKKAGQLKLSCEDVVLTDGQQTTRYQSGVHQEQHTHSHTIV
uniref:Uncharacterized protein n=1 Tax=Knipowitschia caucasica TaxID=637954 RepID=A0AAV2JU10_KNICA